MDPNNPYSQQYAPTQQQYPPGQQYHPPQQQQYPPPPQQYAQPPQEYYGSQPPPQYNPPLQQTAPIQQSYNNGGGGYAELGEAPLNANDKIRPSSGFKDIWAAILWMINMAGFIALTVIGLRNMKGSSGSGGPTTSPSAGGAISLNTETIKIFGLSAAVGFGLSFLYLMVANIIPGPLIVITFVGSIIVYLGVTAYYFYMRYYPAAIVFLIFSLLYMLCFYLWRDRIPFAKIMLKSVTSITRKYWSTLVTGLISLVVQTIFSVWFMITCVGVYQTYYSDTSSSKLNAALVFLVFSFYWTTQVISYVTHVTLSGVFATVYFLNNQVSHPIWGSAKRAMTTSFGSICFGGLLVALLSTVRFIIDVGRSSSDDGLLSFVLCILDCIVGCIQGMLEWFNQYAFSGVAIYGQGFVPSAKRTWSMIQDRGVDAMINDSLIGNVLFMGTLLVGILSSLLGYLYLIIAKPAYNATGNFTPLIMLICFIIGMSMFSTIATVITSGVTTTFVCLAEDPEALRRVNPELYEAIRQTWPQVVQGI